MSQSVVPFKLIGISTEQFALIEENFADEGDFNLEIGIKQGIEPIHFGFSVFFSVIYSLDKQVFLKLEVGGHFQIEETAWQSFIDDTQKNIIFPKGLVQHLAVITIGTSRGIVHAKTENTKAHGLLLPTIDLTGIITEDVPFELTNNPT